VTVIHVQAKRRWRISFDIWPAAEFHTSGQLPGFGWRPMLTEPSAYVSASVRRTRTNRMLIWPSWRWT